MVSRSTGERASARASSGARRRGAGAERALAAFAGGAIFASTSPPIDFTPGILLGLVFFAWAVSGARRGFRFGWLFGLGANLVALRFVPEVIGRFTPLPYAAGVLALVLLSGAQAIVWGIGGGVATTVAKRIPTVPRFVAFAIGIYLATFVPAIFPWTPAGGLSRWPAILQIADVVGERGVTFVVALACGLAADALRASGRTRALGLAIAAAIPLALAGFGAIRMASVQAARARAPHAKVALVQPGFDATDRWDPKRAAMMIERLTQLTKAAEERGVDLVVWPESAYPYPLPHGTRRSPFGYRSVLQGGVRTPVLTGIYLRQGPGGADTNSAVLATPDGALSTSYDKRHLLWFGETVPLADVFPWLRKVFARGTGLEPGTTSVGFTTGPIRAAVLNCYEDTLPVAGREAMETAPNLLVNVTNDAWFSGSAEGELHLRLAVLRAIESRRDFVRAVNEGPTSFVDASGTVVARYDGALPKSLPVEPALLDGPPTFYARFGDAPLLLLVAAALATRVARARTV